MFGRNFTSLINNQSYKNTNIITISSTALKQNLQYLRSINSDIQIAPVLKSNAYGHGLGAVAKILDDQGCPFYCIDSLYEAYKLYTAKITTPVLIMGYVDAENLHGKKLPFSYAVFDIEFAKKLNAYQKGAKIHLKIDTGMHRLGVPMDQLERFLSEIKPLINLTVDGVMSHLASGAEPNADITKTQVANFQKALALVEAAGFSPRYKHLFASDGLFHLENCGTNVARVGLALYGVHEAKQIDQLRPALQFQSHIAQIKHLRPGDSVGYDATFTAEKPVTIAIIPAGYNDGVDRRLSNRGVMTIANTECPIIGRVSMNMAAIDVSAVQNPSVGMPVVIFSNTPQAKNAIQNSAKICDDISHDLLVHLHPSTKRIVT